MGEKIKIILDVDTGSDDAAAIMMAALEEKIELLAVCTVAGNLPLENTTENTLRVRELLGAEFPVYRGCSGAMLPNRQGKIARISMHQESLSLPPSVRGIEAEHAVFYYIDTLLKSAGDITLVAVAPLTNLAMAMRLQPEICGKIKEIVLMGGGTKGNRTPAAEFNIWCDPEAAQIVLDSGVPIRMVPLDATLTARVSEADVADFRKMGTPAAEALAEFVECGIRFCQEKHPQEKITSTPLHDALAVCAVAHPEVLQEVLFTRVDVDCGGGAADGQTVVDRRGFTEKPRNVQFACHADTAFFVNWMKEQLKKI